MEDDFPYLMRLMEVLGEGASRHADPAAWDSLEGRLGFSLPEDFKRIIDLYAPVRLNSHLSLFHPATARWNLEEYIVSSARAWSGDYWEDIEFEGDGHPAALLGLPALEFGTAKGLVELVATDRGGESIFLGRGARAGRWRVFTIRDDECYEHAMDFSEWLFRYLAGEDVVGPNSAAFYPGPIKFKSLPMSRDDRGTTWYGPDRGM
ncbi:SMI1/KNR4 family protein [Streptomyces sp. NPDC049881]|uniref:SMI1/KNR4 family protein n=1 Tax=Streptomyces sp. NPDC049881 TaxID=3155778 RepID=UPI00342478AA